MDRVCACMLPETCWQNAHRQKACTHSSLDSIVSLVCHAVPKQSECPSRHIVHNQRRDGHPGRGAAADAKHNACFCLGRLQQISLSEMLQMNTTLSGKDHSSLMMLPSMVDQLPNGYALIFMACLTVMFSMHVAFHLKCLTFHSIQSPA